MNPKFYILFLLLVSPAYHATAQEEGKSRWNPFSTANDDSEVRQSSFFDGKSEDSEPMIKLPKLNFFGSKKSKKGPSTLGKMTASSKRMWNSTVDFLNPFDSKAPQPQRQMGYQPQAAEPEKKGMFNWLWKPSKDPEELSNVNDFLSQPRPRF